MSTDQRRSAALLLWPRRTDELGEEALVAATEPFQRGRPGSLPRRLAQAVAMKRGRLGWEADVVEPLDEARRAALGGAAAGEPRVLVRVDEFPNARGFDPSDGFGTEHFKRFHAVLTEAEVPYLLAITPRVSRDYLDPTATESRPLDDAEAEQLLQLQRDGVVFGLHGLDHRTRHASPRRHSEFCGLSPGATGERIDEALRGFAELGLEIPVFVPPFNRFDARQYGVLAERFEVVCGGPESVRLLGFSPTPAWRGDAVYLPSYAPLYERAAVVAREVERLSSRQAALWAPATLHWGWELEDEFAALRRLCQTLAGRAADWGGFLEAVAASRAAA